MGDDEFFGERKAAAVLKHGILSRYVTVFAAKVGSRSKDSRVAVLDAYAGEGRYDDGSPGSPILMTATARQFAGTRQIELHFVEREKSRFDKLNQVLQQEAPDVSYKTYRGDAEEHLDTILTLAEGVPFFAFLDPFGLGLTFDDVVSKIYGRPHSQWASPGTEVLINFSADAIRRIGGLINKPARTTAREATLARLDAVCGGNWWQAVYQSVGTPEEAAEKIADEYFNRLTAATKASGWVIPVKNAYHHQPKYSLIFLSRHPDGLVVFGDALSMAMAEWRKALAELDPELSYPAYIRFEEEALAERWVQEIKKNIAELLTTTPQFVLRTKYLKIMGTAAGNAREMHVRKAIKELYAEGVTSFNGVSTGRTKLWDQTVVRA